MSRTESKTGNKVEANYLPWHTFTLSITSLSAYCLFLFTAPTSNPFPLGWKYSQLRSTVFPLWDIRLISDGMANSGCTVCVCASSTESDNRHRILLLRLQERGSPQGSCNGYSDVNDQGYYDLQEALTSSPKTNCIPVFDEELLLASPPQGYTLTSQVMLWIFINVFHSTTAGLSHHQWPMPFIICLSEQRRARE